MTLENAQTLALNGHSFGDVYPKLSDTDAAVFKGWWLQEQRVPVRRLSPQGIRMAKIDTALNGVPRVSSGNVCKNCGGNMIRAGKCEYCPLGCGSEGECS